MQRHKDMQDLARELLDLKEERRQLMGSVTWPPDPTSHQRAGQQAIEIEKKQAELGVQLAQLVASGGSLPTAEAAMATAGACIIQVCPMTSQQEPVTSNYGHVHYLQEG